MNRWDGDGLYGSTATVGRQRRALADGDVPVAVYGLGKMGLPLAAVYAETAGSVIGVDVDPAVVASVNAGASHVDGEPGLDELVADRVDRGRLRATTDGPAAAAAARVHAIIVPTLLTDADEPDLSTVEAVLDDIAAGLSPGDLVVLESTVPPGTARDAVVPTLAERSDVERGEFGVAVCPERTSSGTALRDIRGRYPKVVGGVDAESARAAALLYGEVTDGEVHVVSDATTAEAVKVFEGIYRDVNIALANELATTSRELGISVREAIETANELPMCQLHEPGPGVGGHCIPNYPHFLRSRTETPTELTIAARRVNDRMPAYAVDLLAEELEAAGASLEESSVLVLGLTYRPGVAETRRSPAIEIVDRLGERAETVYAADPLVDPAEYGARPASIDELSALSLDAAIVVTPHAAFEAIDWERLEPMVVLDGRDALAFEDDRHRVRTLGGRSRPTDAVPSDGGRVPLERAADRR